MSNLPIALTLGEPAGIGADIVLLLWKKQPELFSNNKIVIIGSKKLLQDRADLLNINCNIQDSFTILDVPLSVESIPGKLNPDNSADVITTLEIAATGCLEKKYAAVVTGPVHKGVINDAGIKFIGQTDFLARFTHTQQTVMMLMTRELKVALLTDHIPLNKVSENITQEKFESALKIITYDFQTRFNIANPRILICGINPHAGENGYLGMEEKNILIPVINKLANFNLIGPVSADIAFTEAMRKQSDVILAMYHDQGLPVLKYAGFHQAINVTLGLPLIRVSVDHGTALDIAGTGAADMNSLWQALLTAQQMVEFAHASSS